MQQALEQTFGRIVMVSRELPAALLPAPHYADRPLPCYRRGRPSSYEWIGRSRPRRSRAAPLPVRQVLAAPLASSGRRGGPSPRARSLVASGPDWTSGRVGPSMPMPWAIYLPRPVSGVPPRAN